MGLTEFSFRLLLLGTPGLICFFLLRRLIGKVGNTGVESVCALFLFSVISYLATDAARGAYAWWHSRTAPSSLIDSLFGDPTKIKYTSVLFASIFSVPLALALSALHRHKVWNRIAQKIGATFRYGDESVFSYFLQTPKETQNNGWVFLRDQKKNLVYYGFITIWSEEGVEREVVMKDVDVFADNGTLSNAPLYSVDSVYICRKPDDISIEIPKVLQPSTDKNLL